MATFLVLQQETADRLSLDQTVSSNSTRLKRWINLIIQDILSRYDWTFNQQRAQIQTVVDKTAGTVSVVAGSTSVTGTSTAFASTDKRSFIQFADDTNWYEVTVVASQVLTLSQAYQGTTNTAATYTLRKVFYDLPTDVLQVEDVRQFNTPLKLTKLGITTLDLYQPDIQTVSQPSGYYLFRQDPDTASTSAKQTQIAFYPSPDNEYNMEIRYWTDFSDLSADGDISGIPVQYHTVILDGAEYLGKKFLSDNTEEVSLEQYELGIQNMITSDNRNRDYFPILGSSDMQQGSRFLPFPSTFSQPE